MNPNPYGHSTSTPSYSSKSPMVEDVIRYYIVRADKTMVPLVPVDQLPFKLQDVPRQLGYQDIGPGKWVFLKETREPAVAMHVEATPPSLPGSLHFAPDHHVKAESEYKRELNTNTSPSVPRCSSSLDKPLRSAPLLGSRKSASQTEAYPTDLSESIARIYRHDSKRYDYAPHLPPSGIEPDFSKKEYCTHWIKTGECAFLSQGCKYKHEIPSLDKLRDLGFNTIPKWYKDKTAIRLTSWVRARDQGGASSRETGGVHENSIFRELREQQRAVAASSPPPKSATPATEHEDRNCSSDFEDNTGKTGTQMTTEDLLIDLGSPVLAPTHPRGPSASICSARSSSESEISIASRSMSPVATVAPRQDPIASLNGKPLTAVPTHHDLETSNTTALSDKHAGTPKINLSTKPKIEEAASMATVSPRRAQVAVAPKRIGLSSSKYATDATTTLSPQEKDEAGISSNKTQKQITKHKRERQLRERRMRREPAIATPEHASA